LVGQLGYNKLQRYVFIIDDPNPGNFISINCIPETHWHAKLSLVCMKRKCFLTCFLLQPWLSFRPLRIRPIS